MPRRMLAVALALCALLAPLTVSAQSTIDVVVSDIDAFWAQQFDSMLLRPAQQFYSHSSSE